MRSPRLIASFSILLLLLSSCGFKDIDRRFLVVAVGVDQGKSKKFDVSLRLMIPSPKIEPGEAKDQVISQEADSIAEAVRLMKSKVDKEFEFGHTKVIILGKEFVEKQHAGQEQLDWFFRRRDIQSIAYLGLGEPDAKTVLNTKPKSERLPGNALILAFSSEGTESPYIATEFLFDYKRRLKDYGKDPYLPIVKSLKETFEIDRAAVFQKGVMKLELTPQETSALNQIVRKYTNIILTSDMNGQRMSLNVVRSQIKYRIIGNQDNLRVVFNVRLDGEVEESTAQVFDKTWTKLEQHFEDQVAQDYTELLRKLQKANTDPIGMGLRYRATRHNGDKEWETWKSVYPHVQFKVKADVEIRGTGIVK